ncbi:hypothetical protein BH10ACI1_BH10ACI1_30620 [soil metagenome]
MKKCPSCHKTFSDDNYFCLEDGTTLLLVSPTGTNPPVFPTADNATTQVISHPQISAQNAVPNAPKDTSKWLFLIIGVLATALLGMGIFMFAMRGEKDEKKESANQNMNIGNTAENANRTENSVPKNTPNTSSTINTNQTVQPKIDSNLTPVGSWSGDLTYPRGAAFSARADLKDDGTGRVRGQIVWTLLRTANSQKANLVGVSATEYVQGTFDAATRTVLLNGYQTDDPNGLKIIKDKYKLILSENNEQMSGFSFGGKTRGKLGLRR